MLVRSPDHTARQGQSQEEELDALITIQRVTGKKKIKRAQIAFPSLLLHTVCSAGGVPDPAAPTEGDCSSLKGTSCAV